MKKMSVLYSLIIIYFKKRYQHLMIVKNENINDNNDNYKSTLTVQASTKQAHGFRDLRLPLMEVIELKNNCTS